MLYLDSPVVIQGITLYRDYNEKSRFYYLPNSPRLSVEGGQPMFQLLVYRDIGDTDSGPRGGGFLAMTTDLGVSENRLQRIRDEVSSLFGVRASLAPVPVKSGTVRVTALDSATAGEAAAGEMRFVENIVAHGTPSLYGDQRAAFTAELSQEGAVLMKAALEQNGATPVVLVYDLQYVGLHPAYDVTITIKFRQSYEHLRTRMQMNTLWFRSDIDREMESLRKSGAIKIEEVVYETETPEATADRMTRLNNLAKELAQWNFFKPALNPGEVLAKDRGTLTAYDARPDLTSILAGLTSTSRAALTGVGAGADVGSPRRPGAAVATGAVEGGRGGTTAGGGAATTPAPAAPSGGPMTAVEAWNRAGRPQGAYMLRSLEQDERQEIKYELHQVAAVERSIAPQGQIRLLEGAADLPGRILEVDLADDFFKTIEGTITTTADLAAMGVTSVNVKLRYGAKEDGSRWKDEAEAVLSAAGDSKPYRFFIDHLGSREVEYQVILTYRSDFAIGHEAATEESEWIPTTTRNLDINPVTFSSVLRVSLEAAMVDWESVQQIQARIHYEDAEAGIEASDTKILTSDSRSAVGPIRPKDPEVREVTVEATFFYSDGETETVAMTQDGDEPFVINQPPESTTVVDVRLADMLERYQQVVVQLARAGADPPEVERTITLGEGKTSEQWSFRREDPADVSFSFKVAAFLKDGAVIENDWVTTDNPLVIVGDVAAGVLSVEVMFLGPLADGGQRLAKLELTYPDAPSWADPNVEQVFRTGDERFTWRVPMARADATSYTYEVTWFGTDGQRTTTGPVTTNDEILLLDPNDP